jgi:hypothetical protein
MDGWIDGWVNEMVLEMPYSFLWLTTAETIVRN